MNNLILTYFDKRAQYHKTILEAEVCDWDEDRKYIELSSQGVFDKAEAVKLRDWLNEWIISK